jgi:hypothetical protein
MLLTTETVIVSSHKKDDAPDLNWMWGMPGMWWMPGMWMM